MSDLDKKRIYSRKEVRRYDNRPNSLLSKFIFPFVKLAKKNFLLHKTSWLLTCICSIVLISLFVVELLPNNVVANKKVPHALENISKIVEINEARHISAIATDIMLKNQTTVKPIKSMGIKKMSKKKIVVSWDAQKKYKKSQLVVLKKNSGVPVQSFNDGQKFQLENVNSVVDKNIKTNSTYTYALFLKQSNYSKPILLNSMSINTRKNQSELPLNDFLSNGNMLISDNNKYNLIMNSDGGLKLTTNNGVSIWSPNNSVDPNLLLGAKAVLNKTGNFQVVNANNVIWQTNTKGSKGTYLKLKNNGDVQLIDGKKVLWAKGLDGDLNLGDDYPFAGGSPLGYSPLNCTDYVAWRLNESAGVKSSPWKYYRNGLTPRGGNAVQWVNSFSSAQVNRTPGLGSVAWWGSSHGGGAGHVAYVTKVYRDGSVDIEEYNFLHPHAYGKRHLVPKHGDYPEKFIHINDL